MKSLNEYLQHTESSRGEEEAGKLRFLLLLFLFTVSLFSRASLPAMILPPVLALVNILPHLPAGRKKIHINPYILVSLEILFLSLWPLCFGIPGMSFLLPLYIFMLYSASLRLRSNLIVMAAVESIIGMNLVYFIKLFPLARTLSQNLLDWPGFINQIYYTLLLVAFAVAVMSRPRIIKRLVQQQQVYFDTVRNENTLLRDSLESLCSLFALSGREKDVLDVLIQGKTYRMIAGELYISTDTVKSHVKSIYRKCGAGSREELISVLQEAALVRNSESE
ncbi:MAG: helix-turn-helix transcriptional regulator [Spirochaetales bacterium]|nr:helix-turn-helix transcriptional regulator [Spirochaetales bacterium]